MNNNIRTFINDLISDYAKSTKENVSLSLIHDVEPLEQENIITYFFNNDPETKARFLDYVQELIDERLITRECEINYENGLRPTHDSQTGEVRWI
jgi:hypothetical protein